MQQALLCSAPPIRNAFRTKTTPIKRCCARNHQRAAGQTSSRSVKHSAARILKMLHASPSHRHESLVRAEERDSLMVSANNTRAAM